MVQKMTENFAVLVALAGVIVVLYSCAFKRMWRERKDRLEADRVKPFVEEEEDLEHRSA